MPMTHGMVYMIGFPVGEIAPGEHQALDWKLDDGTEGTFKPTRLCVMFGGDDKVERRAAAVACTVVVSIAGRSVTNGTVPAEQFALPDPAAENKPQPLEEHWPCFKNGDPLSIDIANNGLLMVTVNAVLKVAVEEYERVEWTTSVLSKGEAVTVVLQAQSAARIHRLEFETPTEWNPDGWSLEQMGVNNMPMLIGGASFPTTAMASLLDPRMGAARIPFVRAGSYINLMLRRTGDTPAALTARAVLDTMAGRIAQQNAESRKRKYHGMPKVEPFDPDADPDADPDHHTED